MEHQVVIVGVGPGDAMYLLPAAKEHIAKATVLVGGKRLLEPFVRPGVRTKTVSGDLAGVVEFIRQSLQTADVTVLVSGDPGFYSLLPLLRRNFSGRIQVIPGISSMQLAFARIGLPWQDALLTSVHGRAEQPEIWLYRAGKIIGLLTDRERDSAYVVEQLLAADWSLQSKVWICSRLSYPDETISAYTLSELRGQGGVGHCVMIIEG